MNRHLFIFGFGFSSEAIASRVLEDGWFVTGTTRSKEKAERILRKGVTPVLFGGEADDETLDEELEEASHVLVSIAPDGDGDPVLRSCGDKLMALKDLKWIGYLSTVGVYGDHDGAWVDEDTEPKPVSRRSVERVAAEKAWRAFAAEKGVPLAIFRLSGIYGPGRNTFKKAMAGETRRLVKKDQVFNRIHREDIGKAVRLAMSKKADGIFNITDNEPAPPQDVVAFAHELAGTPPPPEQDFATAKLTPMARSFYGENKRVSNAKSKEILGMEYDWPDYRTSLKRMWKEGSWKG